MLPSLFIFVNSVVIIAYMDQSAETGEQNKYYIFLLVGGLSVVILCTVCVLGGYYVSEEVMPAGAQTRTALVQLFSTVTPAISTTPIPSTTKEYPSINLPLVTTTFPTPSSTQMASPTYTFEPPEWLDPPVGKIVYTCTTDERHQICLMQADGSDQKQLTDTKHIFLDPSLSPDGTSIVFSSNHDGRYQIYEISVTGEDMVKVSADTGNSYSPEISPNGNRIVFVRESGNTRTIWIMKRDGSNNRPVLSEEMVGENPTWAPDNNRIAFVSSQNSSNQIYITNILGEKVRQVTKNISGIHGGISWSPNGTLLAFSAGSDGDKDIYLIGSDGESLQKLTDGGDNLDPYFSPDGKWIAFHSYRDGKPEIYVIRSDGVQETRLTGTESSNWRPHWSR